MIKTSAVAGLAAASLLAFCTGPSFAAPTPEPAVAKVAEASAIRPAAVTETEEEATCSRVRRRLWIEGEGWVVRRITTCR